MSIVSADADAEARWTAASHLADGLADSALPRRRRRALVMVVALIVGSWIVGFGLAFFFAPSDNHSLSVSSSSARLIAESVLLGLGLIIGIVGFIWGRRTGHYVTRWRSVASPLNRGEKKSVNRQISGKERVDEAHLPIVLAIATQNRKVTLGVVPIYAAAVLFAIGTAVGASSQWIKMGELVVGVLFIAAAIQLFVAYRRAGRFIAARSGET